VRGRETLFLGRRIAQGGGKFERAEKPRRSLSKGDEAVRFFGEDAQGWRNGLNDWGAEEKEQKKNKGEKAVGEPIHPKWTGVRLKDVIQGTDKLGGGGGGRQGHRRGRPHTHKVFPRGGKQRNAKLPF